MKRCSKCKLSKDEAQFVKDRSRPDGLNHRCKPCNRLHVQKSVEKKKSKLGADGYRKWRRKYELNHYYGVSQEEFNILEKEFGDLCAICRTKPERHLAVDHCHVTNKVRGLLCRKCNSAIGLFDDDIEKIERALAYLKIFKKTCQKQ